MSEPIKVGDLVQVVYVCCDKTWLNNIFQVSVIDIGKCSCVTCGKQTLREACASGMSIFVIPTSWLKRIPPLSELESTETNEESHA